MEAALRQAGAGWIKKLRVVREGVVHPGQSVWRVLCWEVGQWGESHESPHWSSHRTPSIFCKRIQGKVYSVTRSEASTVLYSVVWHLEIVCPPRKILQLKRESHRSKSAPSWAAIGTSHYLAQNVAPGNWPLCSAPRHKQNPFLSVNHGPQISPAACTD